MTVEGDKTLTQILMVINVLGLISCAENGIANANQIWSK